MPLIDPCGIICIISTYIIAGYADYILITYVILPTFGLNVMSWILIGIFNILIGLIVFCQAISAITDPGRLKKPVKKCVVTSSLPCTNCKPKSKRVSSQCDPSTRPDLLSPATPEIDRHGIPNDPNNQIEHEFSEIPVDQLNEPGLSWCRKCAIFRPAGAHHCSTCGVCIASMDHHCPWINNCVGQRNQKYFVYMLAYTLLTCAYAIALISVPWLKRCLTCPNNTMSNSLFLHSIILVFVCLLLITFVIIILYDQIKSAFEQESVIDRKIRLKTQNHGTDESTSADFSRPKVTCVEAMSYLCGTTGPSLAWFIPCMPPKDRATKDNKSTPTRMTQIV